MLLRDFIRVLHITLVDIEFFILLVLLIQTLLRALFFVLPSNDLNLHSIEHLFKTLVVPLLSGDDA
jgi:hypothetical protein